MKKYMDAYNLRARLSPAFLVLLPILFGLTAWVPNIQSITQSVTGAAVSAGVLFVLAYIASDAGKKAEGKLLVHWGGWPSVLFLRHCDTTLDTPTKRRYHAKLQASVKGVSLPFQLEEEDDPKKADEQYNSCRRFLLNLTRDNQKFPLVKEEVINYGFRRKLFGLRAHGLAIAASGVILCAARLYRVHSLGRTASVLELICSGASILSVLLWAFLVNEEFVRRGADAYALKLLEAIETL